MISWQPAAALYPFGEAATGADVRRLKLAVSIRRFRDRLEFHFTLGARSPADLADLVLPAPPQQGRQRRDELWKNSCLELFVGAADQKSYVELNMSPGGDWNVYVFDGYREGMRPAQGVREPFVKHEAAASRDLMTWSGVLMGGAQGGDLGAILTSPGLVLGATAVLEYRTGTREYWALAHAGPKPDFHLRESFRLTL